MPITRLQVRALLPAVLFAAVVLAINGHWFRVPFIEDGDLGANSIQVYHAKMFREMLGNYSRWQFHHPGPVFFYLFAAGEYLFYDFLRIVPAPMNAQLLTLVLVNTALLFGSIEIFARHSSGTLFRPLALAAAVLLIYTVNHLHSNSALVSLWMPYVALFAFLFFASACASVAAGRAGHLPLLALGAMTMVHLHVVQFLFAGIMSLAACLALAIGAFGARAGRQVFRQHAGALALSAGIVVVFLLPMVLELVLHKPNNLDYVLAYLRRYPNPDRGILVSARYLLSFLTFSKDADQRVFAPASGLLAQAASTPHVAIYWAIFTTGLCAAVALVRRFPKLRTRVALTVLAEGAVIGVLFLYWANRITGAMYSFNGYFIYSIHLLGLFLIAGTVSAWQANRQPRLGRLGRLLWAVPLISMVAVAGEFRNLDMGSPAIRKISDELRSQDTYQLLYQHDDWFTAAGVANQLVRRRQAFCISADWGFLFGYEYVCRPSMTPRKVVITSTAWFNLGRQPLKLPVVIETDEVTARKEGFYAPEGDHCWSQRTASLFFSLERDSGAAQYRVTVTGSVLPYRPVELSINGRRLGVVDGIWKSSISFLAGREFLRPGEVDRMTFHTASSGPIAGDARDLGFSLMGVRIEAAGRE
ncbi:MAG: hypothetical protein NTW28_02750 [Candidatus Solibacter sp.]|nr:hypothetical protein [Candidatus Solibacter sp.]